MCNRLFLRSPLYQHPTRLLALVCLLWTAALLGCHHHSRGDGMAKPTLPVLPGILSLSESQPFTSVAFLSGKVFAATARGLLQFHQAAGFSTLLTRADGLPGDHVYWVASERGNRLWVATDGGLGLLHKDKWTRRPLPAILGRPITALLPTKKLIWVGSNKGLWSLDLESKTWKSYLRGARISYLLEDVMTGSMWVGTDGAGIYHLERGKFVPHSTDSGQDLRKVRCMTYTAEGGLMAAGSSKEGERLTFFDGKFWTSYTFNPAGKLHWVQQVGQHTMVSFGRHLLRLKRRKIKARQPGMQDTPPHADGPVRLQGKRSPRAPSTYPVPPFYTERMDLLLPPEPTSVVGAGKTMLMGTSRLGVAMFDGERVAWYRTNDLTAGSRRLKMACRDGSCFLPTSNGRALQYTRKGGFIPARVGSAPTDTIQGFLNHPSGELLALHTPAGRPTLVVSVLQGDNFYPLYESVIAIPNGRLGVRFLRAGPGGRIWVGLWYSNEAGENQPWGVVLLPPPPPLSPELKKIALQIQKYSAEADATAQAPASMPVPVPTSMPAQGPASMPVKTPTSMPAKALASGSAKLPDAQEALKKTVWARAAKVIPPLLYYRSTLLADEDRAPGSLALPDDIRDVWWENKEAFWVATGQGVCRVQGTRVDQFTENEGLDSELTYAVGRNQAGQVLVAGYSGVGRYAGGKWYFDLQAPLNTASRALALRGDTLWVGTSSGLVRTPAKGAQQPAQAATMQIFNERHGLASNIILDLYLEQAGRVWALTDKGLSVVTLKR